MHSEFVMLDRRKEESREAEVISRKDTNARDDAAAIGPKGLIWSIENPDVCKRCIEVLVKIRRTVERSGLDLDRDEYMLRSIYDEDHHLHQTLRETYATWWYTSKASEKEREAKGLATRGYCKERVLNEFDAEISRLKKVGKTRDSIYMERMKVEALRQRVPDSGGFERFLRYEAHLQKMFERTSALLERAQRLRKGHPLPPEVNVKIDRDD
jgi:hypothetical protein